MSNWWDDPKNIPEVTDLDIAFGAGGRFDRYLPEYDSIPDEFHMRIPDRTKWNRLFSDLFYRGVKNLEVTPKPGVDPEKAWKFLSVLMRSFGSKHEHKTAGVAFLMSVFFEDAKWEANEIEKPR